MIFVVLPRLARLDAHGVLYHIIIRGIELRAIFRDDLDRENFLERLSLLVPEIQSICYAWVFMSNHAHFLLRSGPAGLAYLMRRLLTGYAHLIAATAGTVSFFKIVLEKLKKRVIEIFGVEKDVIYSKGRRKFQVAERSRLCYWPVC